MEIFNRLIAKPELILVLMVPFTLVSIVLYFGVIRPLFRRDYTIYKGKENKFLINLLNWNPPNWGKRFESHFKHYGPILVVSNQVYMRTCARSCRCQWMEIKGEEKSSH